MKRIKRSKNRQEGTRRQTRRLSNSERAKRKTLIRNTLLFTALILLAISLAGVLFHFGGIK